MLEIKTERRAGSYFGRYARRLRVYSSMRLADLLDDAIERGALSEEEREQGLNADLVMSGQRRDDRSDAYFLVEVSSTIDPADVWRAADRAMLLAKLGRPAHAIVAGYRINGDAVQLAEERRVQYLLLPGGQVLDALNGH